MTATGWGRSAVALLVPIAAFALLAAACATNDDPPRRVNPGTGVLHELTDPVVPLGTIVPLTGGGDFPDPARVLLQEADRELRAGDFAAAAETARRASAGADPATKCVADAVQGVADVNLGNVETGLKALQDGECAINVVPGEVRDEMTSLIYRSQAIGNGLIGNEDAAEFSLQNALRATPDKEDVIVAQFCRAVGQSASSQRCTAPVTTTRPVPSTTQMPPSPPVTSPRPTPTTTPTRTPTATQTPTPGIPTTSGSPTPTSVLPTTSRPTTADDNGPATPAG